MKGARGESGGGRRSRGGGDAASVPAADQAARGVNLSWRQVHASAFPFDYPACRENKSSSFIAKGLPMKILLDEEVTQEVRKRQSSPGVIARLMGLDAPPPSFESNKQDRRVGNYVQTGSPVMSQAHYHCSGGVSGSKCKDEIPVFKDVFEVVDTTRRKSRREQKWELDNSSLKSSNCSTCDMDFIKQKFTDAKRLSTDELLRTSTEFNETLEALVSNRDLLLEFLKESNVNLADNYEDGGDSPMSPAKRITILKPSKLVGSEMCSRSSKDKGKSKHTLNAVNFKPCAGRLDMSNSEECARERSRRTKIVVLKPSLEKALEEEAAFPLIEAIDAIGRAGYRKPCVSQESNFTSNYEGVSQKARNSREIARHIKERLKRTSEDERRAFNFVAENDVCDKISHPSYSVTNLKYLDVLHRSLDVHDQLFNGPSSSMKILADASLGRYGKRRSFTHNLREPARAAKPSSTLGEMLALAGKEGSKVLSHVVPLSRVSLEELHGNHVSSTHEWNDINLTNYARPKSLPTSIKQAVPKISSRRQSTRLAEFDMLKDILESGCRDVGERRASRRRRSVTRRPKNDDESCGNSLGEDEVIVEREIHVNSEELRATSVSAGQKLAHPAASDIPVDHEAIPGCQDITQHLVPEELCIDGAFVLPLSLNDKEASILDVNASLMQDQGIDQQDSDGIPRFCNEVELRSPTASSKEDEHPSPSSVLEHSLDDDEGSCSGYFNKIGVHLQELRMQLQHLKMDTAESDAGEMQFRPLSDDECDMEMSEAVLNFSNDEERDFCYMLDMLVGFPYDSSSSDELFDACTLTDCPVSLDMYDQLEWKYGGITMWPRLERKLLFDLTNSVLKDFRSSRAIDCQASWEGFIQHVWQRVCQQQIYAGSQFEGHVINLEWFGVDNSIDLVREDVESMLTEHLVEELVVELFS